MASLIWAAVIAVLIILFFAFLVTHRKTALPNEVLIISGAMISGKHSYQDTNGNKVKLITNGGAFILPIVQRWDALSLNTRTIEVATPEVYTKAGVPIKVDGTVILKIGSSLEEIATAAEQFLGKDDDQINGEATEILEGHLRAILGTLTVEDTYQNREVFAEKVQEVASSDLAKMGLEIVSFTIKDITDSNGYLDSLGKKQIAEVKKDAAIAEAEADKERRIKQAEADQLAQEEEIKRQTQVADSKRAQAVQVAEFEKEQQIAKAQADQASIAEQMKAKQVQKEKDIELAQKDADLQEMTLNATVRKQADASRYQAEQEAAANKAAAIAKAEAEAEQVKLEAGARAEQVRVAAEAQAHQVEVQGEADAKATELTGNAAAAKTRAIGLAEAEATEKKAAALAKMNESGKLQMVLDVLPQLFAANADAYKNVDHVTLYGQGDVTGQSVENMTRQLQMIHQMTGIDIEQVINSTISTKAGTAPVAAALAAGKPQTKAKPAPKAE